MDVLRLSGGFLLYFVASPADWIHGSSAASPRAAAAVRWMKGAGQVVRDALAVPRYHRRCGILSEPFLGWARRSHKAKSGEHDVAIFARQQLTPFAARISPA